MTSAQKVASSLLVSVLAFSVFAVAAFSGLFDFVEIKFYQPAVKQLKEQKLDEIKDAENEYLENLMTRFNIFEMEKDVKTYADLRPDDISVQKREKLRSALMTETAALLGIRLVDDNGSNVYFSTFDSDKIKSAKGTVSYKNYDSLNEFPFELVKSSDWISENAPSDDKGRVIKDTRLNRLIFSFPFYDSKNLFRGTLLFYCDASHINRYLFSRNLIDLNGFCVLVAAENGDSKFDAGFGGYVFGLPNFGRKSAEQQILSEWKENPEKSFWKMAFEKNESAENLSNSEKLKESPKIKNLDEKLLKFEKTSEKIDNSEKFSNLKNSDEESDPKSYFVFSKKLGRSDAGFVAAIYDENELKFPRFLRLLLLVSAFITFYLVVFLIFSFKHDDLVVVKSKIASFKKQFVRQYKKMAEIENDSDLELHKKNLEESIKKSLGRLAVKYEPEFQNLFEKCWNEILLEIEKPYAMIPKDSVVVSKNELREILEDIVGSGKFKVNAVETEQPSALAIESVQKTEENVSSESKIAENGGLQAENFPLESQNSEKDEIESLEVPDDEIESLEPADEEIESLEPADEDENPAENEDSDNVEELETIDEENDGVEDLEPVDEIEELEPLDDEEKSDSVEELQPLDDVEELASLEAEEKSDEKPKTSLASTEEKTGDSPMSGENLETAATSIKENQALPKEPFDEKSDFDDVYKDEPFLEKIDLGMPETKASFSDSKTENDIIDNFSTENLDYAFLDEEPAKTSESPKNPKNLPDIFDSSDEKKSPENSESSSLPENENGSEKKIASNSPRNLEMQAGNDSSSEILSENPDDFSKNYEEKKSDSDNIIAAGKDARPEKEFEQASESKKLPELESGRAEIAETKNQNDTEEISALEELESPEETMPFSFIQIAANDTNLTELRAEVSDTIVQNSDGTFRIADKSAYYSNKGIDLNLKKLVDSVLKN